MTSFWFWRWLMWAANLSNCSWKNWIGELHVFLTFVDVYLPLTVHCFPESTQPITTLCSSVSDWEGPDTRSSFCFSTGEDKSSNSYMFIIMIINVTCGAYYHHTVALKAVFLSHWKGWCGRPDWQLSIWRQPGEWYGCFCKRAIHSALQTAQYRSVTVCDTHMLRIAGSYYVMICGGLLLLLLRRLLLWYVLVMSSLYVGWFVFLKVRASDLEWQR